jgi:hypothetical protein
VDRAHGRYTIVEGILWVETATIFEPVELWSGFDDEERPLGWAMALFPSPIDDRLTALYSAASANESTIATLVSTTDGNQWERVGRSLAGIFDSSTIADVVAGGDGLLAVGASPGGEFVPTAAVFTSANGVEWTRVTPAGGEFGDAFMSDVVEVDRGFVAVGGDHFVTGLMAAWTSPDGHEWHRSASPNERIDPRTAFRYAETVEIEVAALVARGVDYDATREPTTVEATWKSTDGGKTWRRVVDH